jgi:MSHA pilin protein MshC
MVELIVIMIVIGILAVVVLPRMDLLGGFDEVGYRDKVKSALEFARKAAVAQRRNVQVVLAGTSLVLTIDNDVPEGAGASSFPRALPLPATDSICGGATNAVCWPAGGSISVSGPASLSFTPLGRPSSAATYQILLDAVAVQAITVEAETGYVH